jgi:NADH dehydrogenase
VAHPQALHLAKKLRRRLRDQLPLHGQYRHFGFPVSLGQCSRRGNPSGSLVGGNIWIESLLARAVYQLLYKLHELSPHGTWKTTLGIAARLIARCTVSRVKLHG